MAAVLPQAQAHPVPGGPTCTGVCCEASTELRHRSNQGPLDTEAPADLVSVEGLWPPCRAPMTEMELTSLSLLKGVYSVMGSSNHDSLPKAPANVMGLSRVALGDREPLVCSVPIGWPWFHSTIPQVP